MSKSDIKEEEMRTAEEIVGTPHQLQVMYAHYMDRIRQMMQQTWRHGFGINLAIERLRTIMWEYNDRAILDESKESTEGKEEK